MMHRIFLAINLQKDVKEQLMAYQEKWPELPAKWTKPENLHITLNFIGNVSDKELENMKEKVRKDVGKQKPFVIKLSRIAYGPPDSQPRMIWAIGEEGQHVTLARLREWEFRKIDPEERPEINEKINIEVPVNSIEIMESKLKRGGAEYSTLQSFTLGEA